MPLSTRKPVSFYLGVNTLNTRGPRFGRAARGSRYVYDPWVMVGKFVAHPCHDNS